MRKCWVVLALGVLLGHVGEAEAMKPIYRVTERGLVLEGVSSRNPILYDNDWWTDVSDAAYLWVKASLGQANLRGNIVTRCTFGWEEGYAHTMEQSIEDANKLYTLARQSGLRRVPEPVLGAREALRKPASGKVEDTRFSRSPGSDLIVAEARKASPKRPLLVFTGGSCTTVASAYLTDPRIAERMVVFQIDGGGYNGSDGWAWEIAKTRLRFANWARGYFWDTVSTWNPEPFNSLPRNPLCDFLRDYAFRGHGKANQWGDGPWLFWLYDPGCLTKVEDYDGVAITVPREGTQVARMQAEFLRTLRDPRAYAARQPAPRQTSGGR